MKAITLQEELRRSAHYAAFGGREAMTAAANRLDLLEALLREAYVAISNRNVTDDEKLMLIGDIGRALEGRS